MVLICDTTGFDCDVIVKVDDGNIEYKIPIVSNS